MAVAHCEHMALNRFLRSPTKSISPSSSSSSSLPWPMKFRWLNSQSVQQGHGQSSRRRRIYSLYAVPSPPFPPVHPLRLRSAASIPGSPPPLPSLFLFLRHRSPSLCSPRMMSQSERSEASAPQETTKTVRCVIKGRVQGVFYRNWTMENATQLGLNGWVRNRRDGSVEALFSGKLEAVDEMQRRCRYGPPDAVVTGFEAFPWSDDPGVGFQLCPAFLMLLDMAKDEIRSSRYEGASAPMPKDRINPAAGLSLYTLTELFNVVARSDNSVVSGSGSAKTISNRV